MFFPQSKMSCLQKFNFRQTPHYSEMRINNIFFYYVLLSLIFFHSACEYNREPQYFSNNAAQERCETFKLFSINYHWCLHPEASWTIPGNVRMKIHFFPGLLLLHQIMPSLNWRAPLALGDGSVCAVRADWTHSWERRAQTDVTPRGPKERCVWVWTLIQRSGQIAHLESLRRHGNTIICCKKLIFKLYLVLSISMCLQLQVTFQVEYNLLNPQYLSHSLPNAYCIEKKKC